MPTALWIAHVNVTDPESYAKYAALATGASLNSGLWRALPLLAAFPKQVAQMLPIGQTRRVFWRGPVGHLRA